MHTESRREARKAFLALSGISNNEDQDKVSSQKSRVEENAAESFDNMRASGNTPVSSTSVSFCFICSSQ
jgi:G patch domain-containing protein 1